MGGESKPEDPSRSSPRGRRRGSGSRITPLTDPKSKSSPRCPGGRRRPRQYPAQESLAWRPAPGRSMLVLYLPGKRAESAQDARIAHQVLLSASILATALLAVLRARNRPRLDLHAKQVSTGKARRLQKSLSAGFGRRITRPLCGRCDRLKAIASIRPMPAVRPAPFERPSGRSAAKRWSDSGCWIADICLILDSPSQILDSGPKTAIKTITCSPKCGLWGGF